MGEPSVKVGVVDIGTNSMRLLITDGVVDDGRWVEVTGLGQGVDRSGRLAPEAMERSLAALRRFGSLMDETAVARRMAIATSATRDAANRDHFLDAAARALGARPTMISGADEARLAYVGATAGMETAAPVVVSDIGGGSTEFVTGDSETTVDIGSVRLTERRLPDRPASNGQVTAARDHVRDLFADVRVGSVTDHVGVAGTWTSLSAISQELVAYDSHAVHGHVMTRSRLEEVMESLAGMSVEETAAIPCLDPMRARVILAGSIIALGVMEALGTDETVISERDTLDGAAQSLLEEGLA